MYIFRDNNKPINVLTGIDYWLDNLICNVPELVMCFHVNGIVQVRHGVKGSKLPSVEWCRRNFIIFKALNMKMCLWPER
jgi:hypothetical protein